METWPSLSGPNYSKSNFVSYSPVVLTRVSGLYVNISNASVDPNGLAINFDHTVHHNHHRTEMCCAFQVRQRVWTGKSRENDRYCCSFQSQLLFQWWLVMLLPVLVFLFYVGLFESSTFWIKSNYHQIYMDHAWLSSGPFRIRSCSCMYVKLIKYSPSWLSYCPNCLL